MNDMPALQEAQSLATASEQRDRWLQMLRTACNTVGQPSQVISAMTVTAHFEGVDVTQRDDLLTLAKLLASEYNLQVEIHDTGTHLEARLSHRR